MFRVYVRCLSSAWFVLVQELCNRILVLYPEVQKFESPLPIKYAPEPQFAAFRPTEYNYANFAVPKDGMTL